MCLLVIEELINFGWLVCDTAILDFYVNSMTLKICSLRNISVAKTLSRV